MTFYDRSLPGYFARVQNLDAFVRCYMFLRATFRVFYRCRVPGVLFPVASSPCASFLQFEKAKHTMLCRLA